MGVSTTTRACLVAGVFTAGVIAATGPGFAIAAIDKAQDVFITNRGDEAAVPTRPIGTTKVDASGQTITIAGKADVSGSRVDVSGSKVDASGVPITIQGDPAGPAVPVTVTNQPAGEGRTPYQQRVEVGPFSEGATFGTKRFVEVPADEQLTITAFSGYSTRSLNNVFVSEMCDAEAPGSVGYGGASFAVLGPVAPGALQTVNQATTLVLDPGTCGFVTVGWSEDPLGLPMSITVTGYTTKVQAAGATAASSARASDAEVDAAARRHAMRMLR